METAGFMEVPNPANGPEVISLLDSDDDVVVEVAAPASASRRSPEVINLLETKPAARKRQDENNLDRKPSAKKRRRASASNEVIILDGPEQQDNRKAPPVASLPEGILEISESKSKSPLMQVLELFPDVDVEHVKRMLREQNGKVEMVASLLVANSYPKQKKDNAATNEKAPALLQRSSSVVVERLRKAPKYDYSSPNSFQPSTAYLAQAIEQLMYDFSFLKQRTVHRIFTKNHERYTMARRHIQDVVMGKVATLNIGPKVAATWEEAQSPRSAAAKKPVDEKQEKEHFSVLKAALIRGRVSDDILERIGRELCVKHARKKIGIARPAVGDEILQDELRHFELNLEEWMDKINKRMQKEAARKMSIENGSAISCACCFDDVAKFECVPCKEKGHMFCSDCIQQYVETNVFGSGNLGVDRRTKKPATELLCCAGECTSGFKDGLLQQVLPTKTWEKYCELQHIAVVEQAGLGDAMSSCSKCGFKAYVPETQILFECPVKGCLFISCKKCGKEPHIPLRCEEVVQKKRQDEGRLKIEEALSEAKMRTCPKCKKKFIKSDGCNKMVCPCGLKLCYVCRSPLDKKNPYQHFCSTPHCTHESCGKCKLHSNTEEDDEQAMREAGITAAERYKAQLETEEDGKVASAGVNLDVDQIMHDPTAKARARRTPNANGARAVPGPPGVHADARRAAIHAAANRVRAANQARLAAPHLNAEQARQAAEQARQAAMAQLEAIRRQQADMQRRVQQNLAGVNAARRR